MSAPRGTDNPADVADRHTGFTSSKGYDFRSCLTVIQENTSVTSCISIFYPLSQHPGKVVQQDSTHPNIALVSMGPCVILRSSLGQPTCVRSAWTSTQTGLAWRRRGYSIAPSFQTVSPHVSWPRGDPECACTAMSAVHLM